MGTLYISIFFCKRKTFFLKSNATNTMEKNFFKFSSTEKKKYCPNLHQWERILRY